MKQALIILCVFFALQSFGVIELLHVYEGDSGFLCLLADVEDEQKEESEKESGEKQSEEDSADADEKIFHSKESSLLSNTNNIQYLHFSVTLLPNLSQGLISPPPEVLV